VKQVVLDDVIDCGKAAAVQIQGRRVYALYLDFRKAIRDVFTPIDESVLINWLITIASGRSPSR